VAIETPVCVLNVKLSDSRVQILLLRETNMTSGICCNDKTENCMFRLCKRYSPKKVPDKKPLKLEKLRFKNWGSNTVDHSSTPDSSVKITRKEEVEVTVEEVKRKFNEQLFDYMGHGRRMNHQPEAMDLLKESISPNVIISIDWSENYNCKYSSEIQAMHFGGSH